MPVRVAETVEELRANAHNHYETAKLEFPFNNFRNWRKVAHSTAYIFRFIRNTRPNGFSRMDGGLTMDEIQHAENFHIRTAQQDTFQEEISILRRKGNDAALPKRSPLFKLVPFLDDQGILRMKGRTGACKYVSLDAVNPIILPRDHPITHIIIRTYHDKFHHHNHESVINEVRQKFCVARLRQMYAKVRSDCPRCKLRDAGPNPPAMADLPACRLAAYSCPFTHTGIDYFGPMEVSVGRRVEKR
ncbi:uncharacterized protein LOC134209839 [Armigeres subalbatus]|uniref:uncharacterized protein LOC134209839 n=1 Tax=Armigeres subalbatus TaxID=124917 RepID=UPI002ED354AE